MKPSEVRPHPHRLPPPTLPGEVLEEEWLKPRGMSQTALAEKMGLHVQVVNGIVQGRRAVTLATCGQPSGSSLGKSGAQGVGDDERDYAQHGSS